VKLSEQLNEALAQFRSQSARAGDTASAKEESRVKEPVGANR
jgi:hypothetical protein